MPFFLMDKTYSDWRKRISVTALQRLISHGSAISRISGEKNELPRLLISTSAGIYVYLGEVDPTVAPENQILGLLANETVEMCAPVRVTALNLFRKPTA